MRTILLQSIENIALIKTCESFEYYYEESQKRLSFREKLKTIFFKNYKPEREIVTYITDGLSRYSINGFSKKYKEYYFVDKKKKKVFCRPKILIDYISKRYEEFYFKSDKEAENYYNQIINKAKEYNLPFIKRDEN